MEINIDGYEGEVVVGEAEFARAEAEVPEGLKRDIRFAHDNIRRFAEAQKATIQDCEVELQPGFRAG